jgi:hypothetical protein
MPPKTGKKSKAEEALAFLDDLDNLDGGVPADAPAGTSATPVAASTRVSTDGGKDEAAAAAGDAEAESALAFLEAQIAQKRAPLSKPAGTPRTGSPAAKDAKAAAGAAAATPVPVDTANANVPSSPAPASGWGMGSFWSTATSALQTAQRAAESARVAADEQFQKVRTEGVAGVSRQLEGLNVGHVDIGKLRKDAEERLGGIVQKAGTVDLGKLRE